MADPEPIHDDWAAQRVSARARTWLETYEGEVSMHAPLTSFLILTVAVAAGCSQPVSPTSPTSAASVANTPSRDSATTFAAEIGGAAATRAVPLKGRLEGTHTVTGGFPLISVHLTATGTVTHLGQFRLDFPHDVNLETVTLVGTPQAQFTGANGDVLITRVTHGVATPTDAPGVLFIVETHTINGGTGRFAGATGRFVIERVATPPDPLVGTTAGSIEGTISLSH